MTKLAGSGSINQMHGSADPDPDPHQNVMDPEHWLQYKTGDFLSIVLLPANNAQSSLRKKFNTRYEPNFVNCIKCV